MAASGALILRTLLALGAMQVLCGLLARGLGRRLERPAVVLGLALPLVLLTPWFGPSRLLFPGDFLRDSIPGAPLEAGSDRHRLLNDAVFQFIPWELEVRHSLKEGRLPLWSDLLEGGSSPWSNPQAGVLSPIALAARWVPIQDWLLVMLALKIQLAVLGAWLLARTVAVGRWASLLAAGGFALSGGVMPWALFPHSATAVWVPWLTAGFILLFRERPDPRRMATVSLLLAALLLSGHPETAAIGGLFAVVCGFFLRARRVRLTGSLAAAVLATLLGIGLAAPHVLPFLFHLPESQRTQETLAREMPEFRAAVWNPGTWFVPRSRAFLWAPTNPRVFGRPYQDEFRGPFDWVDAGCGYAGLVAFAFAIVGIRRRSVWPFLGFAVVGLLLVAEFIPLVALVHAVKVLRVLHLQRFLPVCSLALCIAGAQGVDLWLRRRGWGAAAALILAAGLSLAGHLDPYVALLWLLIGAAAALAAWRPRWSVAVLGGVLLLDLVPWAWSMLPSGKTAFFYPPSPLLAQLRREASQGGPWRAVGEGFAVYPSLLPVYGIAEVRPHNPLAPMGYLETLNAAFGFSPSTTRYFSSFRIDGHRFLDFLNVRYVIWESPLPVPARFERIDDGKSFQRLYRNPDALPRWFVPSRIDVIDPRDLPSWIAKLEDGRRVALFQALGIPDPPAPAQIQALRNEPGNLLLQVNAAGETLIATSLQARGWSARSGGRDLPKMSVNGSFLGFRVPRGESRVELRYLPPGFIAGVVAGGLAALVCGGLLLRGRSRRHLPSVRPRLFET